MENTTWDDLITAVGIALDEAGMSYEDFCALIGYDSKGSSKTSE